MSDGIKSARDIAMEKIAALDAVTSDERLKWKYTPEGEQAAIKYFKDGGDLASAIAVYPTDAQLFVKTGAEKVLLENLQLPHNDIISVRNTKAIDAIISIKSDKTSAAKILDQAKHILEHYTDQGADQRKQAYEMLKQQFETRLKQAVKKQLGTSAETTDLGIKVETLPQFQDEWRRTVAQMDDQYLKLLNEFKQELRRIK
ncbi:MAG: hypothetical protein FWE97_01910 [Dehalococcoidia bacterium]|nr:hypothetical protein [Dehalococcoidia bacterium]